MEHCRPWILVKALPQPFGVYGGGAIAIAGAVDGLGWRRVSGMRIRPRSRRKLGHGDQPISPLNPTDNAAIGPPDPPGFFL
ncbi:MAG: hypothetical protein MH825_02080 [Cyanobacteria bacterium]|nr:hypothetical protein [Cyanobacteriota bacterium]